jgi:hypothetical protein
MTFLSGLSMDLVKCLEDPSTIRLDSEVESALQNLRADDRLESNTPPRARTQTHLVDVEMVDQFTEQRLERLAELVAFVVWARAEVQADKRWKKAVDRLIQDRSYDKWAGRVVGEMYDTARLSPIMTAYLATLGVSTEDVSSDVQLQLEVWKTQSVIRVSKTAVLIAGSLATGVLIAFVALGLDGLDLVEVTEWISENIGD